MRFGEARTAHVGSHAPRDDGGGGGARVPRVAERVVQGTLLRPGVLLRIFRGKNIVRTVRWFGSGAAAPRTAPEAVARSTASCPTRHLGGSEDAGSHPRAARAAEPTVPTGVAAEPLVSSRHRWLPRHQAVRRRGVVTWRDTRRVRVRRARRGGAAAPGLVRGGGARGGTALCAARGDAREAEAPRAAEPCRIAVPPGAPLCERPPWRPRPRSTAHRRRRSRPAARTASWRGSREARSVDSIPCTLLSSQNKSVMKARLVSIYGRAALYRPRSSFLGRRTRSVFPSRVRAVLWRGRTERIFKSSRNSRLKLAFISGTAQKKAQCFDAHGMGSSLGLWWFAPVLSGGGYGSEAVALLLGLHRASDSSVAVRATHHGDAMDQEHVFGLPSSSREALEATLRASTPTAEQAVVVCHSEPGAWHPALYETSRCPPAGAAVAVGRTMFETDRLDPEHVKRLNAMREVWVPTRWGLDTFARAGVRPEKLRVVPEAVDIDRFDAGRGRGVTRVRPRGEGEARARTRCAAAASGRRSFCRCSSGRRARRPRCS